MGGDATWKGAAGLAADVRYYGEWMRERAFERIGHLYPKHKGETVIAWLWARTVISPNPAVNAPVPLVRSFVLSKKKGRECWAKPIIDGKTVRFEVTKGLPPRDEDGTVNRRGGKCIVSDAPIPFDHIRAEGKAGRMGAQLMAIVTEGKRGRSYYSPDEAQARIAESAEPAWKPVGYLPEKALSFRVQLYGMDEHHKLFTTRQLTALTTFSDLVQEAREMATQDALAVTPLGPPEESGGGLAAEDDRPLREGGRGARAYGEAVSVYLAFAVDRIANTLCTIARWTPGRDQTVTAFARQAIPMTWDYPDVNPFSGAAGDLAVAIGSMEKALRQCRVATPAHSNQEDATTLDSNAVFLSTDPPYYDNIGYADLSDFFYVWMRQNLRSVYPEVFSTVLVPKSQELIASRHRHGSQDEAKDFFESGMLDTSPTSAALFAQTIRKRSITPSNSRMPVLWLPTPHPKPLPHKGGGA